MTGDTRNGLYKLHLCENRSRSSANMANTLTARLPQIPHTLNIWRAVWHEIEPFIPKQGNYDTGRHCMVLYRNVSTSIRTLLLITVKKQHAIMLNPIGSTWNQMFIRKTCISELDVKPYPQTRSDDRVCLDTGSFVTSETESPRERWLWPVLYVDIGH